jgi:outer membrane biosynthesis protein TonB
VDDLRRLEAKGLARAKARSRRLRVSRIRSLTFRGSLVLFLILWAVVFVQLASGNDPALSRIRKAPHQQATPASREPQESREPAPEFEPEAEEPVEVEPELEEAESEFEAEPEVEFEEPQPEPEPEPVITSSS